MPMLPSTAIELTCLARSYEAFSLQLIIVGMGHVTARCCTKGLRRSIPKEKGPRERIQGPTGTISVLQGIQHPLHSSERQFRHGFVPEIVHQFLPFGVVD